MKPVKANFKDIYDSKVGVRVDDISTPVEVADKVVIFPRDSKEVKEAEMKLAICPRLGDPTVKSDYVIAKCKYCEHKIFHLKDLPDIEKIILICTVCFQKVIDAKGTE